VYFTKSTLIVMILRSKQSKKQELRVEIYLRE
jgi:hypothetical protein